MAMKKRAVPQKKTANDDTVIYKVMIVLGVACVVILALQLVSRYYRMVGYMFEIRTWLGWASVAFGVLTAAMLVCWLAFRKKAAFWRAAGGPLCLIALVLALSCALLYGTWVSYVAALYFVYIAAAVLYLIALLYQHEFFLLSLINVCAGGVFYGLSRMYSDGAVFSLTALAANLLLVVLIILGAGLMFAAGRHGGKLKLFGRERQLFVHGASPILLYVTCAVWLVCLIASALLGSVFAYYCIFAAVAFELIAAVYYTIKLA